jgi:hypothetical protein
MLADDPRLLGSTNPVPLVGSAVRRCRSQRSGGLFRCEWITRALERNLTELDRSHQLGAVLRVLQRSPGFALDRALLQWRDRSGWWNGAVRELRRLAAA